MPTVLIREPSAEVCELFAHVARHAGFQPAVWRESRPAPAEFDVLLLEPAGPGALEAASELRRERPTLPIVCVSVFHETAAVRELQPAAFFLKPFRVAELTRALAALLPAVSR